MTGALALALIVVRFVAGAAIARPLTAERRLDAEQRHETVRTLRVGAAVDVRPRADADPDALAPIDHATAPLRRVTALARSAPLLRRTAAAPRTARARAPPRAA